MLLKGLTVISNVAFILVSVTFFMVILTNGNTEAASEQAAKELKQVADVNLRYMESRINKVQGSLDAYQVTMTHRITVLEYKIKALEEEGKTLRVQNKNNIHNSNTMIVTNNTENNNK